MPFGTHRLRQLFCTACAVVLFFAKFDCRGQEIFPARPIRIIVYTGPGGLIDLTARKFAEIARKYDGRQPIVVINKPGAGGIVAFDEVLQQPADGYNVLAVTRSNITKIVSAGREDLIDAVDWVAYVMDNPHVVITNKNSGLLSWEDVRRDALSRPGRQLWLGADIGGVKHVSAINVWEKNGIKPRWIPYASGGQAVSALLGEIGHVYFGNPSDGAGKPDLQVVAVCAEKRLDAFPNAPTFAELGVPGLENELIWRGFALKKGTPQSVLNWFDQIAQKVNNDPEWRSTWEKDGVNVVFKPKDIFSRIVEADRTEFRSRLAQLGLLKDESREKLFGLLERGSAVSFGNLLLIVILVFGLFLVSRTPFRHHFGEVAVTLAAATVAASLLLMSLLLPQPNEIDRVGASGVPRLWSMALLLLAAMQLIILLGRRMGGVALEENIEAAESRPPIFTIFLVCCVFYLLAITLVGYFAATLLFLPGSLFLLGYTKRVTSAILTLSWLAFAYFVFEKTLFVDLPRGLISRFWGAG